MSKLGLTVKDLEEFIARKKGMKHTNKNIKKEAAEIFRMMFSTWGPGGSEQKGVNIESDTAESDY